MNKNVLALPIALGGAMLAAGGAGMWGMPSDLDLVRALHEPEAKHVDQSDLVGSIARGQPEKAFQKAFEMGEALFDTSFNILDGVGANVGQGQRFTRVPRADLNGYGEWANHLPKRETGPNAQSCNHCHGTPSDDGAGPAAVDVHRDPLHSGNPASFIRRNAPHLFALGAVQRLAEEMTEELQHIRDAAATSSCSSGQPVSSSLQAKGVDFGVLTASCDTLDTSRVRGVDPDLVVRPLQWKGSKAFIREFTREAFHNELGLQPVETAGDGADGDFDGVVDELSVGDLTAMTIYLAAQPRPTTRTEMASQGLIPALSNAEVNAINRGEESFRGAGCASCHIPKLKLNDAIFSEPSRNPNYRDATFPAGQEPVYRGLDPGYAVTFDLTRDQPENRLANVIRFGSLKVDKEGRAVVNLFGDLKRHDMGPELAESIDETGCGASVFLTESLWGIGATAPYLHDGRASTLTEAILAHGGEGAGSRDSFRALPASSQSDLLAFLNNLVLFKVEKKKE